MLQSTVPVTVSVWHARHPGCVPTVWMVMRLVTALCAQVRMTSSNGKILCFTGHLCGEFTGHRWIPIKRSVTRNFDVFFGLRLNKRLSEQPWGWWFETPSRPLWRHCNTSITLWIPTYPGVMIFPLCRSDWAKCANVSCYLINASFGIISCCSVAI